MLQTFICSCKQETSFLVHIYIMTNLTLCWQSFPRLSCGLRCGASQRWLTQHTCLYSCLEKGCQKNVHTTIPKCKMGYDQYTVPDNCSCPTYFCCFLSARTNVSPWPLVPFFRISLKNNELKTTHDTFRYGCVHLFQTTFLEIAVYAWILSSLLRLEY